MSQFFSLWAMGNGQLGTATAHNALGKFLFITLRKVKNAIDFTLEITLDKVIVVIVWMIQLSRRLQG